MYTLKNNFSFIALLFLLACNSKNDSWKYFSPDNIAIEYVGRFDDKFMCSYSGSSIRFQFEGQALKLHMWHYEGGEPFSYYRVQVDDSVFVWEIAVGDNLLEIDELNDEMHKVELFRRTEALVGIDYFMGIDILNGGLMPFEHPAKPYILFLGNSITCGYGNVVSTLQPDTTTFTPAHEDHYQSYAAITARNLEVDHHSISYSGKGVYRNFNLDTVETVLWFYEKIHPFASVNSTWGFENDPFLIVLNLGTNDFSRRLPPPREKFINKYLLLLKGLKHKHPDIPFLVTIGPMLNDEYPEGANLLSTIKNYLEEIQEKATNDLGLNVRLLYYEPQSPPYGEHYHPTIATHQKMADTLTAFIQSNYKW